MSTDVKATESSTAPAKAERRFASFTDQLIEPFSRLRGELDRLFDEFPVRQPRMDFASAFSVAAPALDMTETKKGYKITAELPGIEPDAVEVSVDEDMLRIAGEKKFERDEDEKGYRISERSYGSFERVVRLPAGARADKIKAKFSNGLLTVTIPKDGDAAARVRKIAVERA
ncbi:MAG: Hsp20/alpha crystallin family protein [Allosphingosinicella sp.]